MDLFRITLADIRRGHGLRFVPFPRALQSMSLTKNLSDSVDYFLMEKVSCCTDDDTARLVVVFVEPQNLIPRKGLDKV